VVQFSDWGEVGSGIAEVGSFLERRLNVNGGGPFYRAEPCETGEANVAKDTKGEAAKAGE